MNRYDSRVIKELKKKISTLLDDYNMILYGSKARGDDTRDSDIDILLLTQGDISEKTKDEISWFKYDLELKYDVVIGLIIEGIEFWNSPRAAVMPFHWSIDREGIAV
jgi:predicted nucleotidyltransferase